MIKRFYLIAVLAIISTVICAIPVSAQDQEVQVKSAFSVNPSVKGTGIPIGATVHLGADGKTTVFGPNNIKILSAWDSEATTLDTPDGKVKATHVFEVPSGSTVEKQRKIMTVQFQGQQILTVINDQNTTNRSISPPAFSAWMESASYTSSNIGYFRVDSAVPSSPPNPGSNIIDYIWNGFESSDGTDIIQPVLEYNYGGSGAWTCAAWCGFDGVFTRATPCSASVNNELFYAMTYGSGQWLVQIYNETTSQSSYLYTSGIGYQNLPTLLVLEGININSNNDVCGDIYFHDAILRTTSWATITPSWFAWVYVQLSGLSVDVISSSQVELNTAN